MVLRNYLSIQLVLLACFGILTVNTQQDMCNYNEPCGTDISRAQCEQRECCYAPSTSRRHNCVQKFRIAHAQEIYHGPHGHNNYGEIFPPDAIELRPEVNEITDKLKLTGKEQISSSEAIKIAKQLEDYLQQTAATGSDVNWQLSKEDTFHAQVKLDRSTFHDAVEFESGTTIQIDPSSSALSKNLSALIFIEYLTMARIFKNDTSESSSMNDNSTCPPDVTIVNNATIISVTGYDHNWKKIPVGLKFTLNNLKIDSDETSQESIFCEFLNETSMHWSSTGCVVLAAGHGSVTCGCNHTTKFSVLFVVQPLRFEATSNHSRYIRIVEFVMEGLSLVCLVITFSTLIVALRRRSKSSTIASARAKERTVVHIHFILALSALHLVRLCSEAANERDFVCEIIVILSHYFVLASGVWMLIEGIVLYVNVILKSMKLTNLGWYKYAAGWGIPAVIVTISAGIGISNLTYIQAKSVETKCMTKSSAVQKEAISSISSYKYCWLSIDSNMIWSAMGPLIIIFAINLFILTHTLGFVLHLSIKSDTLKPAGHKSQNGQHIWNTTKGIFVLFPILGIPWAIGFLVNITDYEISLAFQYVHITLNGLQGVFVFILYCVVNKEVRNISKRVASNKWQQHKINRSRSLNNSFGTSRERQRRSSSIIEIVFNKNQTEKKNFKLRPRDGSQASQQSFFTQRPSLGSVSTNSIALRMKRKQSIASLENKRQKIGPAYFRNLPHDLSHRSATKIPRTLSVKSFHFEFNGNNTILRTCKSCGTLRKTCKHEIIPGLNLEAGAPVLTSYTRYDDTDTSDSEPSTVFNTRRKRMTAEEFKRFSAIPEEKRKTRAGCCKIEKSNKVSCAPRMGGELESLQNGKSSQKAGMKYRVAADIHTVGKQDDLCDGSKKQGSKTTSFFTQRQLHIGEKNSKNKNKCDVDKATQQETEITSISLPTAEDKNKNTTKKNLKSNMLEFKLIRSKQSSSSQRSSLKVPKPIIKKKKGACATAYSEQLVKAIDKWKAEEEKL